MKKTMIAAAGLMALAACGGGESDRQALVDACVSDGTSDQETCECMADAAEKNLDEDLYEKFADAARQGEDGGEEILNDLDAEEQAQFMSFIMQAAVTCGMS